MTAVSAAPTLVERLGHAPDARLVIVSCDDLGLSHASNLGVYQSLRDGAATSASLMVPCPWARDAASRYRGEDIGVHLTLTAEHDRYRWGPITQSPSLLDGDGGFPRTNVDAWEHADPAEVRRECRSQVERAILWGFDVSHLDSHMKILQLRPELFDVYLDLAVEYQLPFRLSDASTQRSIGFPFRTLAAEEGVLFPDHFIDVAAPPSRGRVAAALAELESGVTEVHVQPAVDTPEVRAISEHWADWSDDLAFVTEGDLAALIDAAGATSIGYRELRDAQRAA